MAIDIGRAFTEGAARTATRPGLSVAVAFVVVALLTAVLSQTFLVEAVEALLSAYRGLTPEQLAVTQAEYDRQISTLERQLETTRETSPLALEAPLGFALGGLLAVAVVAEAVSIVAVRAFAAADPDDVTREDVAGGLAVATVNGFVGGVVVWVLIGLGLVLFIVPGLLVAIGFYFLRQEIALEGSNFIDAMADSWRLTTGHRIEVFALGLLVVVVSTLDQLAGGVIGVVSSTAGSLVGAMLGGVLAAFGAAVVTRAYVQLQEAEPPAEPDPYDAPLGPDDIPK